MYERPKLQRYGTLRELTEAGFAGEDDGLFLRSVAGDNWDPVVCKLDGRQCS